jgi:hypothetical protein
MYVLVFHEFHAIEGECGNRISKGTHFSSMQYFLPLSLIRKIININTQV